MDTWTVACNKVFEKIANEGDNAMKKRLSNDHLKIVYQAVAAHQAVIVDKLLPSKIRQSTGFEKAEWQKKAEQQKVTVQLLDELKEVLDKSLLTSEGTEKDLVNGVTEHLEEVFSGETPTQRELKHLQAYTADLEAQLKSQDNMLKLATVRLDELESKKKRSFWS